MSSISASTPPFWAFWAPTSADNVWTDVCASSHLPAATSQPFALFCYCPAWVLVVNTFICFQVYVYRGVCVCIYVHTNCTYMHLCMYLHTHIQFYLNLCILLHKRDQTSLLSHLHNLPLTFHHCCCLQLKTKLPTSVIEADSWSCSG